MKCALCGEEIPVIHKCTEMNKVGIPPLTKVTTMLTLENVRKIQMNLLIQQQDSIDRINKMVDSYMKMLTSIEAQLVKERDERNKVPSKARKK